MSANNQLLILDDYSVYDTDVDTGAKSLVARGKSLRDAILKAQKYLQNNVVEYGIHFVLKKSEDVLDNEEPIVHMPGVEYDDEDLPIISEDDEEDEDIMD